MTPLAVTGLGVVSPIGVGREAWESALSDPVAARAGAFGKPTVLDAEKIPDAWAAEVWEFDASIYLGSKGLRNFDRLTKLLIVAAKQALEDAAVKKDGEFVALSPDAIGICSATAYGSLDAINELLRVAELEDPRYINPARFPNTVINAAAGYVSIWENLRAPNSTIVDGNCGALDAVLSAETHLRHRRGDAFLVGGGEVLSDPLYIALDKLGVLARSPEAREGLHVGEGACYALCERPDEARARGARLLGLLCGYGTAFEPPASEARIAHGSADAVTRAVRGALRDAGLEPGDVDAAVSAEGGIAEIDAADRQGLQAALGPDVATVAPKRIYGETFGAAGALGIAHAIAWMRGAPLSPLIRGTLPPAVRTAVVTTVGFYGNVSAVVVRSAA